MHTTGNRLQSRPRFQENKQKPVSPLMLLEYVCYGLLKCLISKIAELEKQVQLLASVVNTRGPTTSIPTSSFPATSFGNHLSGQLAERGSDLISNGLQASQDSQVKNAHFLANVPAAVSATLTSQSSLSSPEQNLVRPPAIMPRRIEVLQLGADQIDTLFQL